MNNDIKCCEHKDCKNKAKWMVRSHAFGMVTFDHYYCDEHAPDHISTYKLNPKEDIVRL